MDFVQKNLAAKINSLDISLELQRKMLLKDPVHLKVIENIHVIKMIKSVDAISPVDFIKKMNKIFSIERISDTIRYQKAKSL